MSGAESDHLFTFSLHSGGKRADRMAMWRLKFIRRRATGHDKDSATLCASQRRTASQRENSGRKPFLPGSLYVRRRTHVCPRPDRPRYRLAVASCHPVAYCSGALLRSAGCRRQTNQERSQAWRTYPVYTPISRANPSTRTHVELPLPTCPICGQAVALETSKTDEHGHAVHEECYLLRLHLREATTPAGS
jgi:hypothetical protein